MITAFAEFTYDALGRRIRKKDSVANKTNTYYYNDN
jgi:YD repeat-containing protein